MSTPMDTYRTLFPDLAPAILSFFSMEHLRGNGTQRSVGEFVEYYTSRHNGERPQPEVINRICEKLVAQGWMTQCQGGTLAGYDNRYICVVKDPAALNNVSFRRTLACGIYGFLAVYDLYREAVIPLVHEAPSGETQIGTAFAIGPTQLITAWHCIEGAQRVSARGISASDWKGAKIFKPSQRDTDLGLVEFKTSILSGLPQLPLSEGELLQEVMALGYPDVPGYHPTLTAERATIASRLTASRGSIASTPTEIWTNAEVFLVTARVRGGFSGGPLLDTFGNCVGVIVREPASQDFEGVTDGHRYDDLGYGIAMPSTLAARLIEDAQAGEVPEAEIGNIEFVDFV